MPDASTFPDASTPNHQLVIQVKGACGGGRQKAGGQTVRHARVEAPGEDAAQILGIQCLFHRLGWVRALGTLSTLEDLVPMSGARLAMSGARTEPNN